MRDSSPQTKCAINILRLSVILPERNKNTINNNNIIFMYAGIIFIRQFYIITRRKYLQDSFCPLVPEGEKINLANWVLRFIFRAHDKKKKKAGAHYK